VRVAVANQKGGTGKTTTVVNLAAAIAETGLRVLVVDLDAQANATTWLGAEQDKYDTLSVLLRDAEIDEAAVPSNVPGVEVVPATSELSSVERALANDVGVELRLRAALDRATPRDVVLIDCVPALSLLTVAGMAAADTVLVPVLPGALELEAVAQLLGTVEKVAEALAPHLAVGHLLVCGAGTRTRMDRDVIAALRRRFPRETMQTVIGRTVRLAEAYARRQPITVYDPTGKAAEQYRAAAAELLAARRTA